MLEGGGGVKEGVRGSQLSQVVSQEALSPQSPHPLPQGSEVRRVKAPLRPSKLRPRFWPSFSVKMPADSHGGRLGALLPFIFIALARSRFSQPLLQKII